MSQLRRFELARHVYADYNFDGSWLTMTLSHDDAGNLTNDGLFKYTYDAWNRLVGVWYAAGDTSVSSQRVAKYEYDGLPALDGAQTCQGFRRTVKDVTNQGVGVVHGSDAGGATGIQAGSRLEHYFYSGWRVIELRDATPSTTERVTVARAETRTMTARPKTRKLGA